MANYKSYGYQYETSPRKLQPEYTPDKNPYKKPTRNLNRYMTGDDVRWVQFQLQKAGVDCGAIDGSYGNGTYTAIKRYQKLRKLDVDGSCGPKTRESLANE